MYYQALGEQHWVDEISTALFTHQFAHQFHR